MTQQSRDFEDIRYVLKKEKKRPSAYTPNRQFAMLERASKIGEKAVREIAKEFKLMDGRR